MVKTTTGTQGNDNLGGDRYDPVLRLIDYNDIIYGLGGDDIISGGRGTDWIYGGDGNDTIYGHNQISSGSDSGIGHLFGEAGDDTFIVYSQGNVLDGGPGSDTLVLVPSGALTITATLGEGTALGHAEAHEAPGGIVPNHFLLGVTFASIENIVGTGFPDFFMGNSAANRLEGRAGDDELNGAGGDDVLDPGGGHDVLFGGPGNDTLDWDGAAGGTISLSVTAIQTLNNFNSLRLDSIENILGSANRDVLTGSAVGNVLDGNGGDDTLFGLGGDDLLRGGLGTDLLDGGIGNDFLDGGAGADQMYGGPGDDQYRVDNAGDVVSEAANGGVDVLVSAISYVLGAGNSIETLAADAAAAAINLTGNEFANLLIGNAAANVLDGLGGNDVIKGGAGNDIMRGGAGNDTFYVTDAGDSVVEDAGGGTDRVAASVSFALAAGAEIELFEAVDLTATNALDLTGNEFANRITGNDGTNFLRGGGGNDVLAGAGGDDFLIGGAGNDIMDGGAGNDTYYAEDAGDVIAEGAGQGTDRVAALVSYALAAGSAIETLEAVTLAATNAMNLTGNAFNNTIIGNNGANTLTGGGGNDTLVGAGGNDVLIGGSSASAMYGGTGNDTYYVSDTSDAVIELAGEGSDRIAASVSYVLAAASHVEIMEAINSAATTALDLTGSAIGNSLIGNAGANVLDGKGGDDVLLGLGGADTFRFTTAPGTGNIDVIQDFVHGTDRIALDDAIFAMLAPGALAAGAFVTGSAAADNDDRIVYNSATGQLFYDADGSGAGAMVQFATLLGNPALSAGDFIVI